MYIPHMYIWYNISTSYNIFFSYADSKSVYGGVDIEVVRHVRLEPVAQENKLYRLQYTI